MRFFEKLVVAYFLGHPVYYCAPKNWPDSWPTLSAAHCFNS